MARRLISHGSGEARKPDGGYTYPNWASRGAPMRFSTRGEVQESVGGEEEMETGAIT